MPERWINAVVEVTVPLDLPLDVSLEWRAAELERVMEEIGLPKNGVAAGRTEVVKDGEPIESS